VLPGTIRREFNPLYPKNKIVYNPYLIAMGTVEQDFLNPEMIMIGTKNGMLDPVVPQNKNTIKLL
jgi:UDPglucose 6-dehydrogenase